MSEPANGKIDRVLVDVTIAAPVDEVWRALREPDQIRRWFGWDADSLADEIDFIFAKHAEASDADHVIRFVGTDDRFEVAPSGDGAVLRVVRAVAADAEWDEVYDEMTEGWIAFVQQLRLALGRHRGEERRTIYLSGNAREAGAPLPSRALGLRELAAGPAGGPAALDGAGERLEGEVWHRSAHQSAMSVGSWGDGLLIANDRPPSEKAPNGGGWVLLTTYGLDDAAFEALRSRWQEWWSDRYTDAPPDGGEAPAA
jgi:hypothetical protein